MLACIQDIQKSKHIKRLPAARDFLNLKIFSQAYTQTRYTL